MDELGPEFYEDYMSGVYDVVCEDCHRANVVDVVDEDRADPETLRKYHKVQEEEWAYQAERLNEIRMGY